MRTFTIAILVIAAWALAVVIMTAASTGFAFLIPGLFPR